MQSKELIPFSDAWKKQGCVCEVDTDGLLIDKKPVIENINSLIKKIVKDCTGIEEDKCFLEMEEEVFERGFIHMMKNYILLQKDDEGTEKVIVHGAYFVSSRAAKVYDDAVQIVIDYAIWDKLQEQEARDKALDFKMRPLEDFIMNVKMSKNLSEYVLTGSDIVGSGESGEAGDFNPISNEVVYTDGESMSGTQICGLAKQMYKTTGILPEKGTSIPYFMSTDPITGRKIYAYYSIADESLKERINYQAYEELIVRLFEAVGIASFNNTRQEDTNWTESLLN
jgi:hypothetical protein